MLRAVSARSFLTGGAAGAPVRLTVTESENIYALRISAVAENGCFDPDRAVVTVFDESGEITDFMADVLHSPFWCRPQFGHSFAEVPDSTQALLYKNASGLYGCILPLCSGKYVTSLTSENGKLCAVTFANSDSLTECETTALLFAEGENPYELMNAAAKEAARILGTGLRMRTERRYPEVFEYLGWCSWDSLEIWVNEAEVLEKCEEFREKSIPVCWGILDDMWADIAWTQKLPKFTPHSTSFKVMHASAMNDYEADPERFPNGLAGCIGKMKEEYGLKVGVWHPASGYWAGLEPGGKADEKLAGFTMRTHENLIMPDLRDAGKAYQFYNTIHTFLRNCGADFLKIDNQSFLRRRYRGDVPVGEAAKNLHAGIEGSVGANFGGDLINCMGMAAESMFSRKNSAVSRCSDDFQPENREWFAKHVMQCAYNGLVQGQFYYNDWDMWWSDDGQAMKNSILRALSGGPIYVSDRIGRSRAEIFWPLCFSDGRILRPDNVAVPTEDCLLSNMAETARPMKVFNMAGETGYLGAFNLLTDGTAAVGTVSPAEIPELCGDRFVMYEYFSGEYKVVAREEKIDVTLRDADDFRLYSFTPIECGQAVLGDVTKFISVRAVTDRARGFVRLYEGGTLKIYSETPITHAEGEGGRPLTVTADGALYTIDAANTGEVYFG